MSFKNANPHVIIRCIFIEMYPWYSELSLILENTSRGVCFFSIN